MSSPLFAQVLYKVFFVQYQLRAPCIQFKRLLCVRPKERMSIIAYCWKYNFPMNRHVRMFIGRSVGLLS